MSSVKIKYKALNESAENARKLVIELEDYCGEITKRVTNQVNSLPGNDKRGYASNIVSSASAKIKELNSKQERFKKYAQTVETFVADTQQADKEVRDSINSTAKGYVGERSKWEAFCDNVYNFLFVDIANKWAPLRLLTNVRKSKRTVVKSVAERVKDWFKYGKGRYVWNIVAAGAAVIGTIAGAITAVGSAAAAIAAIATGGAVLAAVIGVVVAAAAVLGAAITTANSLVKAYNNSKALTEDDPGVARYVGGINGISDAVEKYDMGDAEANEKWKTAGEVIDTAETVCDIIGIAGDVSELAAVKNVRTGDIAGYKLDKNNIKFNIKESLGFDHNTNSWSLKKMFGVNTDPATKSWFADEAGEGGFKSLNELAEFGENKRQKWIKAFYDGGSAVHDGMSFTENLAGMYERLENGLDFSDKESSMHSMGKIGYTIIDVPKTFGKVKVFKGMNTFLKPTNKVLELFGITEENLDKQYS